MSAIFKSHKLKKISLITTFIILSIFFVIFSIIYLLNYYPKPIQKEDFFCKYNTPRLSLKKELKILSWNIQYMAGTNYIFFYEGGNHIQPTLIDIETTKKDIIHVIQEEDPDILLLQEIDVNAKRTYAQDQIQALLKETRFACYTSSYYWKSKYVPDPKVNGSVGIKLATFSKYKISQSIRYALPLLDQDWLTTQFYLKRAILEISLPTQENQFVKIMNTHLTAFSKGRTNLVKQVHRINNLLKQQKDHYWLIGGDFNLLPGEIQYNDLDNEAKQLYNKQSEINVLMNQYQSVPSFKDALGPNRSNWYTYAPNRTKKLDRTIDYIFFSNNIKIKQAKILQINVQSISDHMPVITTIKFKTE